MELITSAALQPSSCPSRTEGSPGGSSSGAGTAQHPLQVAVPGQGKGSRVTLRRPVAGPKPFQPVRLNLCKAMITVDNKLDLSLGLIPNLAVSAHSFFFVVFPFRFPRKDGTSPGNKCRLSAYEDRLPIPAVMPAVSIPAPGALPGRGAASPARPVPPWRSSFPGQWPEGIVATVTRLRCRAGVLCTDCGWQGSRPEHLQWSVEERRGGGRWAGRCGRGGEPAGARRLRGQWGDHWAQHCL